MPSDTLPDSVGVPDKESGFLNEQIKKLKNRWLNDPDFLQHTKEDLFFGMQDNVNDHMDKNNPNYEKTMKKAQMYDKLHLPYPIGLLPFPLGIPSSFITSQLVNNKIEKLKEKENNK